MSADWGTIDGPYAEDLHRNVGRPLPPAPAVTLDDGLAAVYQSIIGDPAAVPLSATASARVTGSSRRIANSGLVSQIVIGQSTVATRRVVANLSYRAVRLTRPVELGDTIATEVTPIAVSYTRSPDRPRRGKVLLDVVARDAQRRPVARMQRLALVAARAGGAGSAAEPLHAAHRDDGTSDAVVAEVDAALEDYAAQVPPHWQLTPERSVTLPVPGWRAADPLRDTLTSAPELARLTLNHAFAHRDPAHGSAGRRLVYGGHVVGLAQASVSRLVPGVVTILGWDSCHHRAPAFEDDVLDFDVECLERHDLSAGRGGALLRLRVRARVSRPDVAPHCVLEWQPVALALCASAAGSDGTGE